MGQETLILKVVRNMLNIKPKDLIRAAGQGDVEAHYELGYMYDNGKGVAQDYEIAAEWYTLAAEKGHINAQHYLGWLFVEGNGVAQDYKAVLKWWTRAVELGDTRIAYLLGCMYKIGEGVPQNNVTALMWFIIATRDTINFTGRKRSRSADYRDSIAKKMTPAEIEKAKMLATKWMGKHRKFRIVK